MCRAPKYLKSAGVFFTIERMRYRCLVSLVLLSCAGWLLPARGVQLSLTSLGQVAQSSTFAASNSADKALDAFALTYASTSNQPDSYWEVEFRRAYTLSRVEIQAPIATALTGVTGGLELRIEDLRDRVVYRAIVTNPSLGGIWTQYLPTGTVGRVVRFGLWGGATNALGTQQVALNDVRVYGDLQADCMPLQMSVSGVATQSTDLAATNGAHLAVDGDTATFSQTQSLTNSFWLLTLDRPRLVRAVELINAISTNAARMAGLTVRVLDTASNSLAAAVAPNPGSGGSWTFTLPAAVTGRYVQVGLEGGVTNGAGDYIVQLAEVNVLSATNLALGLPSYITKLTDTLPAATNANDGNLLTVATTTTATVDGYWDIDLGQVCALQGVRTFAPTGFAARMSHCTLELFDANHSQVFSRHFATNTTGIFDVDVEGPVPAKFVRVGLVNKERTTPSTTEWSLSFREVQIYGRPMSEYGLQTLTASTSSVPPGGTATLSWQVGESQRLDLYPPVGLAGSNTSVAGVGTLVVAPTSSVEYVLVSSNRVGFQTKAVSVLVSNVPLPLRISEFMADNSLTLQDGNGTANDWIEVHNPNETAVNLAGYGLSDDPLLPLKWVFPATNIAAHGHLIVFASGSTATNDARGYLHANFQLATEGESILLTATNGSTVDVVSNYPAQRADLAYGRTMTGAWAFLEPTPGAFNVASAFEGWLEPADFSVKRGVFTNAFTLAIANSNPGSVLYVSQNGTVPTNVYAGPFVVSSTLCVRADVRRDGFKSPRIKTHSYLFPDSAVLSTNLSATIRNDTRFTNRLWLGMRELPTVSIVVPVVPDDYVEREASMEWFWPDGSDPVQANIGLYRFGNAWTAFAKRSYRMKFRAEYGTPKLKEPIFAGFDHGFLAADSFDEIDLRSGSQDMVERGFYMAQTFSEDTMLQMGSLNPHGRFVNVYLNGQYWGQYHAGERLIDSFLADNLGGKTEDYLTIRGNDNVGDVFVPGVPDAPNRLPWEYARSVRTSYTAVKPWLDVVGLIDFTLMWDYGNSETEFRAAGPTNASSGFKFWVADADGFLRTSALNLNRVAYAGPGSFFGALVTERHPDFMTLLGDRIQKHFFLEGALTPTKTRERLDQRMREITNSMVAECARWSIYRTPDNWESAANSIRTGLFPLRTTNLFTFLKNAGYYPSTPPPVFNQYGGSVTSGFAVTFSSPSGTVYWTVDGSDPRLAGGGISPTAMATNALTSITYFTTGAVWRYLSNSNAPPTNWMTVAFDDSLWPTGRAQLGYGDSDEQTVISYGPSSSSKYPAYYFRRTFTAATVGSVTQLLCELVRDDGAVIYLNGTELYRDNMPTGTVLYSTLASASVNVPFESNVYRTSQSPASLLPGTNTLAVEVHQNTVGSSDISFDFGLGGQMVAVTNTIAITSNTLIRARVLNGTNWSAILELPFYTATIKTPEKGDLLLTEIHYDPDGSDDYEFVEVYNTTTNLLNMSGVRLGGGVDFLFTNGTYLAPASFGLLAYSTTAFSSRYQNATSLWYRSGLWVAGAFSGKLSNGGEDLQLFNATNALLCDVDYGIEGAWPTRAAGKGSSLELREPLTAPTNNTLRAVWMNEGRNWRSSSLYHGSPGRFDTYEKPVVINEILAHTDADIDWIELHNPGLVTVNIGGLRLTDDYNQPQRFTFTNGTAIAAGGYRIFSAAELGFAFSELGSDALIVETAGTNIGRFVDTVDLAATEREETVGRYVRSDGEMDFTELRAITKGTSNALPRVGPVMITEIMYAPATGRAEYIEILNPSVTNLALFDVLRTSNRWELSGAVEYTFPSNTHLLSCIPTIVCSTSPAAFRAQYGLSTNVPVYGPWTGALNNAGESVKLRWPGDPELTGLVPMYRVDRVNYLPLAPWPTQAVAGGVSLERVTLEAYGNDPANWTPSIAGGTPGIAFANRIPTVGASGLTHVNEGDTISVFASAADADVPWQTFSLSVTGLPAGATFNATNGMLDWITGELDGPSTSIVRFIASDNGACGGAAATQIVTLVVDEVNLPPSLGSVPDFRYPASMPLRLQLVASDPDAPVQGLTFSGVGLPLGLALNPVSGLIEGDVSVPGSYGVVVSVADDQTPPLTQDRFFQLVVEQPFEVQTATGTTNNLQSVVFQSISNQTYDIHFSDLLDPPAWQVLTTVTNAAGGPTQVIDPTDPPATQRFYRVLWRNAWP